MRVIFIFLSAISLLFGAFTRDSVSETVYDTATNLTWQDNAIAGTQKRNWESAVAYCNDLVLGGVDDWYLPNLTQLKSIVNKDEVPAINTTFEYAGTSYYWSSYPYEYNSSEAWMVYFGSGGYTYWTSKSYSTYLRCVRDEPIVSILNATLAENAPAGTVIGTVIADIGDLYDANLTCNDENFSISGNSLVSDVSFDYETTQSQTVCISVSDGSSVVYENNFTIFIGNVAPSNINLAPNTVVEQREVGTPVGALSADESVSSYSFCGGSDDALFEINATTLYTAAVLDYAQGATCSVCVRATDATGATYDENLNINLYALPRITGIDFDNFHPLMDVEDTYLLSFYVSDIEGDTLGISVVSDNPDLLSVSPATDELTYAHYDEALHFSLITAGGMTGTATITVSISGDTGSTVKQFEVRVEELPLMAPSIIMYLID